MHLNFNTVVIVEDDISYSIEIKLLLAEMGYHNVSTCQTYADGLEVITSQNPDLIIIDVELDGGKSGINLVNILNLKNTTTIFMTSAPNETYYTEAKNADNSAFLVKPINKYSLQSTLQLLINQREISPNLNVQTVVKKDKLFLKRLKSFVLIKIEDISYIEAFGDYCKTVVNDTMYTNKITLSNYEAILRDFSFFRCHRSYLINLNQITQFDISDNSIELNGHIIPISRNNRKTLFNLFHVVI